MRVHPSMLTPRRRAWKRGAVVAFCLLLTLVNIMGRPRPVAVPVEQEKLIEVLIADELIPFGQPLDRSKLRLEKRPVRMLPADVISSRDDLKDKVAAGPIPAGIPLSKSFLTLPTVVKPVVAQEENTKPEDPIDLRLREIEKFTVALPMVFSAGAPNRGTRIAVSMTRARGDSIMVIEDCWVSKSNGREVILRLSPDQALLMQSAREYGQFGFIEIASDGASPFQGKAVKTLDDLRQLIAEVDKKNGPEVKVVEEKKTKMRGYAWVPGEGIRYGVDESGDITLLSGGQGK